MRQKKELTGERVQSSDGSDDAMLLTAEALQQLLT